MSDLEESIRYLAGEILEPRGNLMASLRAFAAAIQGEKKPTCIDHDINMNCWCGKKQPTPELPREARKELDEIQCEIWKATGWSLDKVFTTFSRIENLCLSMRAK